MRNNLENNYSINENIVKGYCFNTNLEFLIDLQDYQVVKPYHWKENSNKYHPYICAKIEGKWIYLHRYIMGAKSGEYVDHINRDVTDNRRSNLRIVTNQENAYNSKIHKNNTSGYTGVYWSNKDNFWYAQIRKNKVIGLGCYHKKEDAIKARLVAEKEYFGEELAPQRDLFEVYGI